MPLVLGVVLHAAILACAPPFWIVAPLFWWNANALSHPFVHRPFFESKRANALWSCLSSLVLGLPQELWRQRHLAHHAERAPRIVWNRRLRVEVLAVAMLWSARAALDPAWFALHWVPGFALGLLLCALHGYHEHARGITNWSSALGNRIFFNDGYHAEHHAHPRAHWTELPQLPRATTRESRLPAGLRWLAPRMSVALALDALERRALRSERVKRWLLAVHERALSRLAREMPEPRRIGIVGGGLFPRTALAAARVWPRAALVVIDCEPAHLAAARASFPAGVSEICARFDPAVHRGFDLVVLPLALRCGKEVHYATPPAPHLLVHDWIWRRRGRGVAVSWWLWKRLNLVIDLAVAPAAAPE